MIKFDARKESTDVQREIRYQVIRLKEKGHKRSEIRPKSFKKENYMFKHAIVKTPARSLASGITSAPELGKPDYAKALEQHQSYIRALEDCGVNVTILEADDQFPDSCFIEDVAVCTRAFAIVTSPGADSRKGEQKKNGLRPQRIL